MRSSLRVKLALSLPLLAALVLLDHVPSLQGLPLLAGLMGVAFLLFETLRMRLHLRGRANLAMIPSLAACLVLLFAYCKGRPITQAVLLIVTLGVVFDILMVALAMIAEATKRGLKGVVEFSAFVAMGLIVGFALSLILLLGPGRPGGISVAGP